MQADESTNQARTVGGGRRLFFWRAAAFCGRLSLVRPARYGQSFAFRRPADAADPATNGRDQQRRRRRKNRVLRAVYLLFRTSDFQFLRISVAGQALA